MSADVLPISRLSSTEYNIRGPLEDILEQIQRIFAQYPPQGYGTRVTAINHELGDTFAAKISRSNSCD